MLKISVGEFTVYEIYTVKNAGSLRFEKKLIKYL